MRILGFDITRNRPPEQRQIVAEDPRIPVSAENFLAAFGISSTNIPTVTVDSALQVPAVAAAVAFLPRTLAALPLHVYRTTADGKTERQTGKLETVIHENPNPDMDSFKFRQYFWQQVFTGGRGLAFIERTGQNLEALWPMDPTRTTIHRDGDGRMYYRFMGNRYDSADVIDVPFMLRPNMLQHYGPIALAAKAIQLALAMNDYASGFFAGGGVPPLALVGPMPAGPDAVKRAVKDTKASIDNARSNNTPIFPIPTGYELKPVGFDPEKGQMTDARRFQIEEIARAFQLPPVFLQDLSHGTFTNTEQQDLFFVKHLVAQWAAAFEGELNLKIFGRMNNSRFVEHNLDGLMRGDFTSRMTGLAQGIQNGLITPNEGRALETRPPLDGGDKLFIQGATVPLATQGTANGAGNQNTQAQD